MLYRKFFVLLVSLILLAAVYPTVEGQFVKQQLFDAFFFLVLLAAVFAVSQRRRQVIVAVVLAAPTLLAALVIDCLAWMAIDVPGALLLIRDLLMVAFLGHTAAVVLTDILTTERVTSNKIYGAVSVYILVGVIWALIYVGLERARPGSFEMVLASGNRAALFQEREHAVFIYYSFVTLSTLGYGDIVPVSNLARTLAWMEAVTGQLYLAVLIATLVGLRVAHANREE